MKLKGILIWGVTLVAVAAVLTAKTVNDQREYERGYEDAMKEAYKFGLAEKLSHSEHGTVYSFLPQKLTKQ